MRKAKPKKGAMRETRPPGVVCIPVQDQMWTESVIALENLVTPKDSTKAKIRGQEGPAAKRNMAIRNMLQNPSWRWICFLDADMVPGPDMVTRLLDLRLPVAAGLAFARRPPFCFEHHTLDAFSDLNNGPFEVEWAGAGSLLVRREVIEALPSDEPWFDYPDRVSRVNEDILFCRKIREAGFKIVVDPSVVVGHVGGLSIDLAFASAFWRGAGLETKGADGTLEATIEPEGW